MPNLEKLQRKVAKKFLDSISDEMPTVEEVLSDPKHAKVPRQTIALACVAERMVSVALDRKNIEPIMEYMERLPKEYELLFIKALARTNPDTITHKRIGKWCEDNAQLLMLFAANSRRA